MSVNLEKNLNRILRADSVSVIRKNRLILDCISLDIKQHDFVTLIGPNGAGKSMLLKCLMGFFQPDQGQVIYYGKIRIGYVPQYFALNFSMPISVRYFLLLNRSINGMVFEQVVQEVGLNNLLDQQLNVLSGGELQKVLVARALLGEPDLLVLDEAARGLDLLSQVSFYRLIEKIYHRRKLSILMVSHDLHFVMSITKRVICLFRHICCSGKPSSVIKDAQFSSLFGADLAETMAFYAHSHQCKEHDVR